MKLERITIPIAVVGTLIVGSFGFAAWYFGNINAQAQTISEINTQVKVHENKIQNLNDNLNSEDIRMTRVENKVDALLIHSNIDPSKFNQ